MQNSHVFVFLLLPYYNEKHFRKIYYRLLKGVQNSVRKSYFLIKILKYQRNAKFISANRQTQNIFGYKFN